MRISKQTQQPTGKTDKPVLQAKFFTCTGIAKVLFILLFLFILPGPGTKAQFISSFDKRIVKQLSENRSEGTTEIMQFLSGSTYYFSVGIPAAMITTGLLSHDKITIRKGSYIVQSIAVSTFVSVVLKYTINRERPYENDPSVIKAGSGHGSTFPSSHTSIAFATATSLSFAYPKWYVIIPSYLWAGFVGYSRLYLGMHYPTDVFAGAVTGTLSSFLSYKLNNWIRNKKNPTVLPTFN